MAMLRSPRVRHLSAKAKENEENMKCNNDEGEFNLPRAPRKGRAPARGHNTQVTKGENMAQRLSESDLALGDDSEISQDREMSMRDLNRVVGVLQSDTLGAKEATDSANIAIMLLFGLLNERQVKALEDANRDIKDKFVKTCIGEARRVRTKLNLSTEDASVGERGGMGEGLWC